MAHMFLNTRHVMRLVKQPNWNHYLPCIKIVQFQDCVRALSDLETMCISDSIQQSNNNWTHSDHLINDVYISSSRKYQLCWAHITVQCTGVMQSRISTLYICEATYAPNQRIKSLHIYANVHKTTSYSSLEIVQLTDIFGWMGAVLHNRLLEVCWL